MASLSDFLEDDIIKAIFRTGNLTAITVLAFALLTTVADDDDTGVFTTSTGIEVTTADTYLRVDRPPLDGNWVATSGGNGLTSNVAAITYVKATADWSGGTTIKGVAICDNATFDTGNMYMHASVTVAKAILNGDTAEFAIGAVTATVA